MAKKPNSCLANIVQQLMAKDRTTSPGRFGKKSNSSHLGVASSKTSSRSSKRRRRRRRSKRGEEKREKRSAHYLN